MCKKAEEFEQADNIPNSKGTGKSDEQQTKRNEDVGFDNLTSEENKKIFLWAARLNTLQPLCD